MRKKSGAKIMALIALVGIILSIIGTGILILFSGDNNSSQEVQTFTEEDLQNLINKSNSGFVIDETDTGSTLSGSIIEK